MKTWIDSWLNENELHGGSHEAEAWEDHSQVLISFFKFSYIIFSIILSSDVYTTNWNLQIFWINLQSLVGNQTFSWEAQTAWAKKSHGVEQFSGLRSSENES